MFLYALVLLLVGQCYSLDIVDTLLKDPRASTLVQLATNAGLVEALRAGTHTVFAPTDGAFALLPSDTLAALAGNKSALSNVLLYHVFNGGVVSSDLRNEQTLNMLSGQKARVNIFTHNHITTINGAQITTANVKADNGYIHYIDAVIMPPAGNIVDLVVANPNFSTLLTAVTKAGIVKEFTTNPLTVFAPTNDAFSRMRSSDLTKLLGDPARLKETLEYHAVAHTLYKEGLYNREFPKSSDSHSDRLRVSVHGESVMINNAHVTAFDIPATNGVVHAIDHVLIPIRVAFWLRSGVGK